MKNCKGIIMDIDNTIYNYDYCHQSSINLIFNEIKNKYSIPYDIIFKQYEQSKININKYLKNTASSHNKLLQIQNLLESLLQSYSNKKGYKIIVVAESYAEAWMFNIARDKEQLYKDRLLQANNFYLIHLFFYYSKH